MKASVPAILALTVLTGCVPALTRAPEASVPEVPRQWRTPLETDSSIEKEWWQSFGDPRLSELVARAQANNPDIAIAAARVREARAQEAVSRSFLLPTLDLSAPAAQSRSLSPFGTASEGFAAQPVFRASYELDFAGGNRAQVAASAADAAAAEALREAVVLSVTSATATGYITLLALDSRLDVLRGTLEARREAMLIARDQMEAGYTSELELRQAESLFHGAEQQIPEIQAAVTRQENALSQLIGENPRPVERGTFSALHRPVIPAVLPSEVTRRRPDIIQSEQTLAASDARMRVARAQFMPRVDLAASAGAVISSGLSDPVGIWSLGGSVLAPLFSGGRLQGQFDAATAQRDQAAFDYRATVLNAFREVEDQLAAISRLDEQEVALVAQRVAVADSLRHATNRYRAGYSPYLEQVDAQRVLLAVDISLVQLRNDRLTACVALYQALGGSPEGQ